MSETTKIRAKAATIEEPKQFPFAADTKRASLAITPCGGGGDIEILLTRKQAAEVGAQLTSIAKRMTD